MTGETYLFETIRVTERAKAMMGLEKAKQQEREKERKVKEGKLKKKVSYDPLQRLTRIHYYV